MRETGASEMLMCIQITHAGSDSEGLSGSGLRACVVNELPGGVNAAGPAPHL